MSGLRLGIVRDIHDSVRVRVRAIRLDRVLI
jgi:hypothetical protein